MFLENLFPKKKSIYKIRNMTCYQFIQKLYKTKIFKVIAKFNMEVGKNIFKYVLFFLDSEYYTIQNLNQTFLQSSILKNSNELSISRIKSDNLCMKTPDHTEFMIFNKESLINNYELRIIQEFEEQINKSDTSLRFELISFYKHLEKWKTNEDITNVIIYSISVNIQASLYFKLESFNQKNREMQSVWYKNCEIQLSVNEIAQILQKSIIRNLKRNEKLLIYLFEFIVSDKFDLNEFNERLRFRSDKCETQLRKSDEISVTSITDKLNNTDFDKLDEHDFTVDDNVCHEEFDLEYFLHLFFLKNIVNVFDNDLLLCKLTKSTKPYNSISLKIPQFLKWQKMSVIQKFNIHIAIDKFQSFLQIYESINPIFDNMFFINLNKNNSFCSSNTIVSLNQHMTNFLHSSSIFTGKNQVFFKINRILIKFSPQKEEFECKNKSKLVINDICLHFAIKMYISDVFCGLSSFFQNFLRYFITIHLSSVFKEMNIDKLQIIDNPNKINDQFCQILKIAHDKGKPQKSSIFGVALKNSGKIQINDALFSSKNINFTHICGNIQEINIQDGKNVQIYITHDFAIVTKCSIFDCDDYSHECRNELQYGRKNIKHDMIKTIYLRNIQFGLCIENFIIVSSGINDSEFLLKRTTKKPSLYIEKANIFFLNFEQMNISYFNIQECTISGFNGLNQEQKKLSQLTEMRGVMTNVLFENNPILEGVFHFLDLDECRGNLNIQFTKAENIIIKNHIHGIVSINRCIDITFNVKKSKFQYLCVLDSFFLTKKYHYTLEYVTVVSDLIIPPCFITMIFKNVKFARNAKLFIFPKEESESSDVFARFKHKKDYHEYEISGVINEGLAKKFVFSKT